jgi:hypothetical protein
MLDIPKFKDKKEAKKTTSLVHWIRDNIKYSCIIEIKVAKQLKDSEAVYSSQFAEHQIRNLQNKILTHKLSDALRQQQIADVVHFYNANHQVILCFSKHNILISADIYPFHKVKLTLTEALLIGKII